jgi:hypothetical protein
LAIIQNWFAAANLMYRHVFVNTEERCRPRHRPFPAGRHDLRQREQLRHRMPLSDPLRAERHIHIQAVPLQQTLDQPRHTRMDGGTQDDQLPVAHVADAAFHRAQDSANVRVEMLIDRGTHDDDEGLSGADGCPVGGGVQPACVDHFPQRGTGLGERHDPGVDQAHRHRVDVVQGHRAATGREGDPQRQPDPATAAHNDGIPLVHVHHRRSATLGLTGPCRRAPADRLQRR